VAPTRPLSHKTSFAQDRHMLRMRSFAPHYKTSFAPLHPTRQSHVAYAPTTCNFIFIPPSTLSTYRLQKHSIEQAMRHRPRHPSPPSCFSSTTQQERRKRRNRRKWREEGGRREGGLWGVGDDTDLCSVGDHDIVHPPVGYKLLTT